MIAKDPRDGIEVGIGMGVGRAVCSLEGPGYDEPDEHSTEAEEEGGTAAPAIEVDDCGEGEGDVEDILD